LIDNKSESTEAQRATNVQFCSLGLVYSNYRLLGESVSSLLKCENFANNAFAFRTKEAAFPVSIQNLSHYLLQK